MGRDQLVQEIEVSGCKNLVQLEIVAHERYSAHTWGWAVIVDEIVMTLPFWPCFWPSSFLFSYQVHALLKVTLQEITQKHHIIQDIPLVLNTTRRGGYLLNRVRPRDPPKTRGPHDLPDPPPTPVHTREMEST